MYCKLRKPLPLNGTVIFPRNLLTKGMENALIEYAKEHNITVNIFPLAKHTPLFSSDDVIVYITENAKMFSCSMQSFGYNTFGCNIIWDVFEWFEAIPDEPAYKQYGFVIGGVEGTAIFQNVESSVKEFMEVIEEYNGMSVDLFIKSSGFIRIALLCDFLAIDGVIYKCRRQDIRDMKNEMTKYAAKLYLEGI